MFLNYTVLTGPEMNCLTLVGLLYPFHKNLKNLSVSFPTVQISTLAKLEKVRKNVQKALWILNTFQSKFLKVPGEEFKEAN